MCAEPLLRPCFWALWRNVLRRRTKSAVSARPRAAALSFYRRRTLERFLCRWMAYSSRRIMLRAIQEAAVEKLRRRVLKNGLRGWRAWRKRKVCKRDAVERVREWNVRRRLRLSFWGWQREAGKRKALLERLLSPGARNKGELATRLLHIHKRAELSVRYGKVFHADGGLLSLCLGELRFSPVCMMQTHILISELNFQLDMWGFSKQMTACLLTCLGELGFSLVKVANAHMNKRLNFQWDMGEFSKQMMGFLSMGPRGTWIQFVERCKSRGTYRTDAGRLPVLSAIGSRWQQEGNEPVRDPESLSYCFFWGVDPTEHLVDGCSHSKPFGMASFSTPPFPYLSFDCM